MIELRSLHKCVDCKSIVHVLCAEFDKETNKDVCRPCHSRRGLGIRQNLPSPTITPAAIQAPSPDFPPDVVPKVALDTCTVCTEETPTPAPGKKPSKKGQKKIPKPYVESGKKCSSCGQTDHQRKSSLKCPNNKKNLEKIKDTSQSVEVSDGSNSY